MYRPSIALLATALLVVSMGIVWKQRQAKSCPAHTRSAGTIAMVVAAISFLASLGLFYFWFQLGS